MLKKATFPAPANKIKGKENNEECKVKHVACTYVVARRQSVIIEEKKGDVEQKCRHAHHQGCVFVEDKAELHDCAEGVKQNEPNSSFR